MKREQEDSFLSEVIDQTHLKKKSEPKKRRFKKKHFWSQNEDNTLRFGVQKYGDKSWSKISRLFKNRNPKRCRERWFNYLNEQNHDLWWMFLAFKIYGSRWSEIGRILGRGDNIIKNKINCLKRRGIDKFQQKLQNVLKNFYSISELPEIERKLLQCLALSEKNVLKSQSFEEMKQCPISEKLQQDKVIKPNRKIQSESYNLPNVQDNWHFPQYDVFYACFMPFYGFFGVQMYEPTWSSFLN